MSYSLPYGKEKINFKIPADFQVKILESKQTTFVNDVYEKTRNTIMHPTNSPSLLELVKGKKSVCIVVTDISRKCPDKELLIPILEILEKEIKREKILILVASGMHKKMNYEEKIEKYGKIVCQNYQIIDHDPNDCDSLVSLGLTKTGNPVKISKIGISNSLSGHFLEISVTTIQTDFFPFTNSNKDGELIGCINVLRVFSYTSLTNVVCFDSTIFTWKLSGILKVIFSLPYGNE